ncbi:PLANT CADMIUM RESISTANCE 3 [Spatholobus suberectus]|nr:PLANT CADMIUM RESISTANCE 3 [Spatholobus suberectus]
MRQQHCLRGNGYSDCLVQRCCESCALSQEYRELENRGFNMVIGGGVMVAMMLKFCTTVSHPLFRNAVTAANIVFHTVDLTQPLLFLKSLRMFKLPSIFLFLLNSISCLMETIPEA